VVRASPGQNFEIRFFDFTLYQIVSEARQTMGSDFRCPFWLSIVEKNQTMEQRLDLCDTTLRERGLFISSTEEIRVAVHFNNSFTQDETPYYLLYYESKLNMI
jgi:hypothetical protein